MKYKFGRILSMALACCMAVLIMSPAAEAAESSGTYDVYQIFTGECDVDAATGNAMLVDITWGRNGIGAEGSYPADEILMELSELRTEVNTDGGVLNVIAQYVDLESTAFLSGLSLSELTTVTVPAGYYYICNTPGSVGPNDGYTAGITTVTSENGTFDVIPKAGSVSVTKTVMNVTASTDAGDSDIRDTDSPEAMMSDDLVWLAHSTVAEQGDIVRFSIDMTYPHNINSYRNFYAVFEDSLPAGLELISDSVRVAWSGVVMLSHSDADFDPLNPFDIVVSTVLSDGNRHLTISTNSQRRSDSDVRYGAGGITVTYDCKVTDQMAASKANTNSVQVRWSNDPSELPYGLIDFVPEHMAETVVTDDAKASVWTPGLIMHLESASGMPIANAKFELTRIDSYEDADGNLIPQTIAECSIRTPVFSEDPIGQYLPFGQSDRYMWWFNSIPDDGMMIADVVRYDVKDRSPVMSTGSGVLSMTTDENGMMVVTGLPCGTYRLHLVDGVKGYNKLDDIEFCIEPIQGAFSILKGLGGSNVNPGYCYSAGGFQVTLPDGTLTSAAPNVPYDCDNWAYINMQLTSGIVLPNTGGPGVVMYFVIGLSVLSLAGYALFQKCRNRSAA